MSIATGKFLGYLKYLKQKVTRTPRYLLTKKVREYLSSSELKLNEYDRKGILYFLRFNLIDTFNYPYLHKYRFRRVRVFSDQDRGLSFVITPQGHRLYFKRDMTKQEIVMSYNSLCSELDNASPHNYNFDNLRVTEDSILADIGSADGLFSLGYVNKIKKLYLFETEPEWIEALEATFHPWKEKVVIVNKYVSDRNEGEHIALDHFFRNNEKATILKIDVDGAEKALISGGMQLVREGFADILLCTYHRTDDLEYFSKLLREEHYDIKVSNGYMLYIWEQRSDYQIEPPYDFRRGLIHARRKN
ncbi:MAG: FkbM family methyltransferase [Tannerellaceae bacterium]|jgi:hypothetical protein|nr:FkbM family methyltransferase [Tannerellaceae bacterium]